MDVRRIKSQLAERARQARLLALDDALSANVHSLLGLLEERKRMIDGPLADNKVRELRQAKGATQEAMADALKMSPRQLIRIEKGASTSIGTMQRIARYFGLPVAEVFGLDEAVSA